MKITNLFKAITAAVILTASISVQAEDGPFVVMIGTPASGKSINSELLSKTNDIPWINVREELMEEVEKQARKSSSTAATQHKRGASSAKRTEGMKKAIAKLEAGELVSDDSLNALVAAEILAPRASGGFVLDGYPMTVEQAEFLDSILAIRSMAPLKVVYLNIPDDVALERMKKRGLAQDKKSIGEQRLSTFRSMIGPLLDFYGDEIVTEIDATKSKAEIASDIAAALD